jgi:methylthioribose-1-phosphate isomerase
MQFFSRERTATIFSRAWVPGWARRRMKSPLCFPVRLQGQTIYVLDETRLPLEETNLEVKSLEDALEVLGQMKTRAFGQVLLFLYTCALTDEIEGIAAAFKKIRPTFDFFTLADVLKGVTKKTATLSDAVASIVEDIDSKRKVRAQKLAEILPHDARILTICNVNGELVYLADALADIGKTATFFVSETRPYLQGLRLTMWELQKAQIPSQVLRDNQAAVLMRQGLVNCVVTGSDRSTKQGDIVNKIGTYALARLAHYFHIPFYVLTQFPLAIDIEDITIEERPPHEVFLWLKGDGPWPEALYPAFDVTPAQFISGWIDISGEAACA